MMIFGWLFALLGLGALAYAFGWRPAQQGGAGSAQRPSALDILKERYARGEISREEYLRMREELDH